MDLVSQVRQTMKTLINATKNLTVDRDADVFVESGFIFNMDSITFGPRQRQAGTFNIHYVVSPNPDTSNTAPSITYDQIISTFDASKAQAFKDAGLVLISYIYDQSDVTTDPVTGSVSLAFSINIQVTEKTR